MKPKTPAMPNPTTWVRECMWALRVRIPMYSSSKETVTPKLYAELTKRFGMGPTLDPDTMGQTEA